MDNKEITILDVLPVKVKRGEIEFNGYEKMLKEATEFSNKIRSIDVNEESIKNAKKMLADVNKRIKFVEENRIAIKNELMVPYVEFETKIKHILGIVKEADGVIRDKVRELEELEREEKENTIKSIFNSKIKFYNFNDLVKFEDFLKPNMLNKTYSINKIEEEISSFLEEIKNNFEVIKTFDNSEEILEEYLKNFNLAIAINRVNSRKEIKKKINEVVKTNVKYLFIIEDEKEAKLVELLLKENKIKYNMEVK